MNSRLGKAVFTPFQEDHKPEIEPGTSSHYIIIEFGYSRICREEVNQGGDSQL